MDNRLQYSSKLEQVRLVSNPVLQFEFNPSEINNASLEFICNFSSTLRHLDLRVKAFEESADRHTLSRSLRNLSFLSLTSTSDNISSLLRIFSASPIVFLRISISEHPSQEDLLLLFQSLIDYVNAYSSLQRIEIDHQFSTRPPFKALAHLCNSKSIQLKFTPAPYLLNNSFDREVAEDSVFIYQLPILEQAIAFAQWRLSEMEMEEDEEGLDEMFEKCRWLRDEMTSRTGVKPRTLTMKATLAFARERLIELEKEEDVQGMTEMLKNCFWIRAILQVWND